MPCTGRHCTAQVLLAWDDQEAETGYRISRMDKDEMTLETELEQDVAQFLDSLDDRDVHFTKRLKTLVYSLVAFNSAGVSDPAVITVQFQCN